MPYWHIFLQKSSRVTIRPNVASIHRCLEQQFLKMGIRLPVFFAHLQCYTQCLVVLDQLRYFKWLVRVESVLLPIICLKYYWWWIHLLTVDLFILDIEQCLFGRWLQDRQTTRLNSQPHVMCCLNSSLLQLHQCIIMRLNIKYVAVIEWICFDFVQDYLVAHELFLY